MLQHQFGVLNRNSIEDYLATRNVRWCTAWVGWDAINEVGFLCHFDSPISARSTLAVMKAIRSHVGDDHHFESSLFGGLSWLLGYSQKTRSLICQAADDNKHLLNISIQESPLSKNPLKGIDVSIDKAGVISFKPVSGESYLPGCAWLLKPMINAHIK